MIHSVVHKLITEILLLFGYRTHRFLLQPGKDLLEKNDRYIITGHNPYFLLKSHRGRIPRRWVFLSYQVADPEKILEPTLFIDRGDGFLERFAIRLPGTSIPSRGELLRIHPDSRRFRLEATRHRKGNFLIDHFTIKEVGLFPLTLILLGRTFQPIWWNPRASLRTVFKLLHLLAQSPRTLMEHLIAQFSVKVARRHASNFPLAPPLKAPTEEAWTRILATKQATPHKESPQVTVIIPVYQGYEDTLACLYSVLATEVDTPHEVLVIDDASPDKRLQIKLQELAESKLFRLISNKKNLGFVKTVNKGVQLAENRDVLLLNSDTEVYNDWLDRLVRAAYSETKICSVTPLSNNAEICSYPHDIQDNTMLLELPYVELDGLTARANRGERVPIPTAVGFCMYIRRECLAEMGLFNEHHFGKGYGEENDFCMRASAKGWRHLMAVDVFVRHVGGSSFGISKHTRIKNASRIIKELHPGYYPLVKEFLKTNPAFRYRRNIDLHRLARRLTNRVHLFISHDMGGGLEQHVQTMKDLLKKEGVDVVILRPHKENHELVQITEPDIPFLPNTLFHSRGEVQEFVATLKMLNVQGIHLHSLVGYSLHFKEWIVEVAQSGDIPIEATIHDYMMCCPQLHLMDKDDYYCGEPDHEGCNRCLREFPCRFGEVEINDWRTSHAQLLSHMHKVSAPNDDVRLRMEKYFPGIRFTVAPHPEPPPPNITAPPARKAGENLRVVLLGSIGPQKGANIVYECAKDALARQLSVEFVVIGYTSVAALKDLPNVSVTGPYLQEEVYELIDYHQCHLAWFPAVGPETYSFTLSIALNCKLPIVAFDIGAIATRLKSLNKGHLIPLPPTPPEAAMINEFLLKVAEDNPSM